VFPFCREESVLSDLKVDYFDNAPCIELLTCQVCCTPYLIIIMIITLFKCHCLLALSHQSGTLSKLELEFENVGFWGEGKTGVTGGKPLRAEKRTNNKLNPHTTPGPGFEPRTHWWEASALTTAPSLLPSLSVLWIKIALAVREVASFTNHEV